MPADPSAHAELTIGVGAQGQDAVVWPRGELDIATGPRLSQAIQSAAAGACRKVVLRLDEVRFIDASGVRAMLAAKHLLGARLVVAAASSEVRRVLDLTGTAGRLPVDPSYVLAPQEPLLLA